MAAVAKPIAFEVDGERYGVALTVNSLCALEETFGGKSITAIGEDIASGRAGAKGVRALFRAALTDSHPMLTDIEAGRLMSKLGAERTGEYISQAFENVQAGLGKIEGDLPNANKDGVLAFETAGVRVVLSFGMNAQAEIEDYFGGLSPEEVAGKLAREEVSLRDFRAMFRAAAIDAQDLTLAEAGKLMDRIGIRVAGRAVAKSFVGAFPELAKEVAATPEEKLNRAARRAAGKGNPTKSRRKGGTGKP